MTNSDKGHKFTKSGLPMSNAMAKALEKSKSPKAIRRSNERGEHMRANSEGYSPVTKSLLRHIQKGIKHDSAFRKGRMNKDD